MRVGWRLLFVRPMSLRLWDCVLYACDVTCALCEVSAPVCGGSSLTHLFAVCMYPFFLFCILAVPCVFDGHQPAYTRLYCASCCPDDFLAALYSAASCGVCTCCSACLKDYKD